MIEDYRIQMRNGRGEVTGIYGLDRQGRPKKKAKFVEMYQTAAGEFNPEYWRMLALAEIERCGEQEILAKVKVHCAEHCAWLVKPEQLEEYAIDCTCSRAYLNWKEFEEATIIWM